MEQGGRATVDDELAHGVFSLGFYRGRCYHKRSPVIPGTVKQSETIMKPELNPGSRPPPVPPWPHDNSLNLLTLPCI